MENEKKVEELNRLLKGTHMGASIFEDLRLKLKSETLKKEFDEILETFHLHEQSLTALIETYRGEPLDSAGVMGTITDIISHIKNIAVFSDKEILEVARKNMKTAMEAIYSFDAQRYIENVNVQKTVDIMKADYASIFFKLEKYETEFE